MADYYVSRQHYYYSGIRLVEVTSGGGDYAGADMLVPQYRDLGEGREYADPRAAVESAIKVARAWRAASGKRVYIGVGSTGGMGMELEPTTQPAARQWAAARYTDLPKCDYCGQLLDGERWQYHEDPDLGTFCGQYCTDRAIYDDFLLSCDPTESGDGDGDGDDQEVA